MTWKNVIIINVLIFKLWVVNYIHKIIFKFMPFYIDFPIGLSASCFQKNRPLFNSLFLKLWKVYNLLKSAGEPLVTTIIGSHIIILLKLCEQARWTKSCSVIGYTCMRDVTIFPIGITHCAKSPKIILLTELVWWLDDWILA